MSQESRAQPETTSHADHLRVDHPVAHDLMPRRFKDWIVSDRELSTIGFMSAIGGLLTTFLGICVGAAISLGLTLKTVDVPVGKTYMAIWAAFLVSVFLSVLLLIGTFLVFRRAAKDVRYIKEDSEQEKRRRDLLEPKPPLP